MKKIEIPVPEYLKKLYEDNEEAWELDGCTFEVDDGLTGAKRDLLARRQNALDIRQLKLLREEGRAIHEDEDAIPIQSAHYLEAVEAIKGIIGPEGKKLEPAEKARFLDSVGLLARDELCKAVVKANRLGLGNALGSPS